MTEAEGDYIAAMVLKLVRAILDETVRPAPDPVPTSPVYMQYERYVATGKAA